MRNTVEIRYHVPVTVIVDMDRERVERVTVEDEAGVLDSDFVRGIRRREMAARIAEEADWPAWEIG